MDEAVVAATEQDQVVEVGTAAEHPRDDVVGAASVRAAGKATASVAFSQGEVQGRRDRPRPAAEVEHPPAALDQKLDSAVAAEAAGGLGRDVGAVLQLAAPGSIARERVGVDVDDQALSLGAGALPRSVGEERLGDETEDVGVRGELSYSMPPHLPQPSRRSYSSMRAIQRAIPARKVGGERTELVLEALGLKLGGVGGRLRRCRRRRLRGWVHTNTCSRGDRTENPGARRTLREVPAGINAVAAASAEARATRPRP